MFDPSRQRTRFANKSILVATLVALTLGASSAQAAPETLSGDNESFSFEKIICALFGDFCLAAEVDADAGPEILVYRSETDSEIEVDPPHGFTTALPEKSKKSAAR